MIPQPLPHSLQHAAIDATLFNRADNAYGVTSGLDKDDRARKIMTDLGYAKNSHHAYFGDIADQSIAEVPECQRWKGAMPSYDVSRNLVNGVHLDSGDRARSLAVRAWAARLRATPKVGCDAAFLFSAAACYGVRVHVHYKTKTGLMADTQFAAPATAPQAMRPRADVHIGYCENSDSTNHYVSLPALWER